MADEHGKILAQWTFPEYDKPHRGKVWYSVVIGLAALLMFYAIRDANFLFALIILLFAIIVFTHHRSEPLDLTFTVYETGLFIGDRFYYFRQIGSFAVVYEPPLVKRLYIKPRGNVIRNEISIPLQKQNPVKIRSLLLDYIEEDLDHDQESSNDMATRIFKL
jgi:hypothetical protein